MQVINHIEQTVGLAYQHIRDCSGESVSHWCVVDLGSASSDTKPIPLPDWFKIPVDRTISIWKKERDEWELRRAKRFASTGSYTLTKSAEEKYQARLWFHVGIYICALNKAVCMSKPNANGVA